MSIPQHDWNKLVSEGMLFHNEKGFVNDETALDEYTLNQVLRAILNNKKGVSDEIADRLKTAKYITGDTSLTASSILSGTHTNSNTKLSDRINQEKKSREDSDDKLTQLIFGQGLKLSDLNAETGNPVMLTLNATKDLALANMGRLDNLDSTFATDNELNAVKDALIGTSNDGTDKDTIKSVRAYAASINHTTAESVLDEILARGNADKGIINKVFGVNTLEEVSLSEGSENLLERVEAVATKLADDYTETTILDKQISDAKDAVLGDADSDTKDSKTVEGTRKYVDYLYNTNKGKIDTLEDSLDEHKQAYEQTKTDLAGSLYTINSNIAVLQKLIDTDVVKTNPSVKVNYAMYGSTKYPNPMYVPVGENTQLPSIYLNFNSGEYKYGPATGIKLKSIKAIDTSDNSVFSTATSTSVDVNMITMPKLSVEEKTYTYKFECTHSEGAIPKSNVDSDVPNKKIPAGTITTSNTFQVIGYYEGCFYGGSPNDFPGEDGIRAGHLNSVNGMNATGLPYSSGNKLTLNVTSGTKYILIACPTDKTGPTKVINKTVNAPMNDLCGNSKIIATVTKMYGDYSQDYNVWAYVPSVTITSPVELEITLG